LWLHAGRFAFSHPEGGRVELTAALPDRWSAVSGATGWDFSRYSKDLGTCTRQH
jgi:hypothetical protein